MSAKLAAVVLLALLHWGSAQTSGSQGGSSGKVEVEIFSPVEGENIKIPDGVAASLSLEYSIDFSKAEAGSKYGDKKNVDSCFEVLRTQNEGRGGTVVVSPLRCYPFTKDESGKYPIHRTFPINNLELGEYTVRIFLRERDLASGSDHLAFVLNRTVTVSKESKLPRILMNNVTTASIGLGAVAGNVFVPYDIRHRNNAPHPGEDIEVCVEIELETTGSDDEKALTTKLGYTEVGLGEDPVKFCLPTIEDGIVLSNIKPSVAPYKLVVYASDKKSGEEGPKVTTRLQISRLEHSLPRVGIAADKRVLEWKVPPAEVNQSEADRVASGPLQYKIFGLPSAIEQTLVCTELLLLQGGYTGFDLYATYGGAAQDDVEKAIDDGINARVASEIQRSTMIIQGEVQGNEYPAIFYQCDKIDSAKMSQEISLFLEGLPSGVYIAKIHVAYNISAEGTESDAALSHVKIQTTYGVGHFPDREERILITVQEEREFVPSYTWRELREWHSVPLGVESRLPVASIEYEEPSEEEITAPAFYSRPGIRKTARIPNPWQIQLPMPVPCRHFLRSNVYRDMTVSDILITATKQCRDLPQHCMNLIDEDEDRALGRDTNVEAGDLFNKKLRLSLVDAADCQPHGE